VSKLHRACINVKSVKKKEKGLAREEGKRGDRTVDSLGGLAVLWGADRRNDREQGKGRNGVGSKREGEQGRGIR